MQYNISRAYPPHKYWRTIFTFYIISFSIKIHSHFIFRQNFHHHCDISRFNKNATRQVKPFSAQIKFYATVPGTQFPRYPGLHQSGLGMKPVRFQVYSLDLNLRSLSISLRIRRTASSRSNSSPEGWNSFTPRCRPKNLPITEGRPLSFYGRTFRSVSTRRRRRYRERDYTRRV